MSDEAAVRHVASLWAQLRSGLFRISGFARDASWQREFDHFGVALQKRCSRVAPKVLVHQTHDENVDVYNRRPRSYEQRPRTISQPSDESRRQELRRLEELCRVQRAEEESRRRQDDNLTRRPTHIDKPLDEKRRAEENRGTHRRPDGGAHNQVPRPEIPREGWSREHQVTDHRPREEPPRNGRPTEQRRPSHDSRSIEQRPSSHNSRPIDQRPRSHDNQSRDDQHGPSRAARDSHSRERQVMSTQVVSRKVTIEEEACPPAEAPRRGSLSAVVTEEALGNWDLLLTQLPNDDEFLSAKSSIQLPLAFPSDTGTTQEGTGGDTVSTAHTTSASPVVPAPKITQSKVAETGSREPVLDPEKYSIERLLEQPKKRPRENSVSLPRAAVRSGSVPRAPPISISKSAHVRQVPIARPASSSLQPNAVSPHVRPLSESPEERNLSSTPAITPVPQARARDSSPPVPSKIQAPASAQATSSAQVRSAQDRLQPSAAAATAPREEPHHVEEVAIVGERRPDVVGRGPPYIMAGRRFSLSSSAGWEEIEHLMPRPLRRTAIRNGAARETPRASTGVWSVPVTPPVGPAPDPLPVRPRPFASRVQERRQMRPNTPVLAPQPAPIRDSPPRQVSPQPVSAPEEGRAEKRPVPDGRGDGWDFVFSSRPASVSSSTSSTPDVIGPPPPRSIRREPVKKKPRRSTAVDTYIAGIRSAQYEGPPEDDSSDDISSSQDEIYVVEDILEMRKDCHTGKRYYLVKWDGYKESESTWEPRKNLFDNHTEKADRQDWLYETKMRISRETHQDAKYRFVPDLRDERERTHSQYLESFAIQQRNRFNEGLPLYFQKMLHWTPHR